MNENNPKTMITLMLIVVAFVSGAAIGGMSQRHLFAKGELVCVQVAMYGNRTTQCYNPKKCDLNGCEVKSARSKSKQN